MRSAPLALLLLACASQPLFAQARPATITTLSALTSYPGFFHGKAVVVAGEFSDSNGRLRLFPAKGQGAGVDVLWNGPPQPASGALEITGVFLDVGRVAESDPQATMNGVAQLVRARTPGRWPAHGELLALIVSGTSPLGPPPPVARIQALALEPQRYDGQRVTVAGQFAGHNLFGDAPRSPATSRDEFLLRNGGAAVWVTGLPPQGKRWGLDPDSKLDTNTWLEVTGTVRTASGLVWIEASALQPVTAPPAAPDVRPAPPAPPAPPPKVVFSLPAADETDVSPSTTVKFQLSRDLDPNTLPGQVAVAYVGTPGDARPPAFKAGWTREGRVLELTFDRPLDRFRRVRIDLKDGIKGTDGQKLETFTLTFTVGG